jgi:hypothetical protein
MAGFSLDFNDTFSGGLKDGTYETVVTSSEEKQTQTGTDYVEVVLAVRNDIQQQSQNALIFHKVWKSKETGKYNMKSFNTIGKALNLSQGKQYNSMKELLSDFVGKPVLVTIKTEESEYGGKTYTNINVKRWEQSKFPNVAHTSNNNTVVNNAVNISDDDLPF